MEMRKMPIIRMGKMLDNDVSSSSRQLFAVDQINGLLMLTM